MIDKKLKAVVQGGVDNYLGKQPQVQAPRKWQSSPDKPATELAYITEAEKDLILKANIHGGLEGGPNMGPSGIMSLDSFGDVGGGGASGGDTDTGGGASDQDGGPGSGGFSGQGGGDSPADFKARLAKETAVLQNAENIQADDLGIQERENIAEATYGPLQKYTGKSSLFGGANKYGYTDTLPDGSLKPGYGGRIMGGLLGLATGVPFIGGAIGSAYDKGKGLFTKQPQDMSKFNNLGVYNDTTRVPMHDYDFDTTQLGRARTLTNAGIPTQQGDYDIYGNKINELTGEILDPVTGEVIDIIPGYPEGPDSPDGGITTIPTDNNKSNQYVNLVEKYVPDDPVIPSSAFKSRFLGNRSTKEREAIEKMINEKFKYDYNSFGLGDMDGS